MSSLVASLPAPVAHRARGIGSIRSSMHNACHRRFAATHLLDARNRQRNRHARAGTAARFAATFAAVSVSALRRTPTRSRLCRRPRRAPPVGEVDVVPPLIVGRPIDRADAVRRDVGAFDDLGIANRRAALAGTGGVAVAPEVGSIAADLPSSSASNPRSPCTSLPESELSLGPSASVSRPAGVSGTRSPPRMLLVAMWWVPWSSRIAARQVPV
jgi:hypothetical protein